MSIPFRRREKGEEKGNAKKESGRGPSSWAFSTIYPEKMG